TCSGTANLDELLMPPASTTDARSLDNYCSTQLDPMRPASPVTAIPLDYTEQDPPYIDLELWFFVLPQECSLCADQSEREQWHSLSTRQLQLVGWNAESECCGGAAERAR